MNGISGVKNQSPPPQKTQKKPPAVVVLKYLSQILHMRCIHCLLMIAELVIIPD